MSRYQNDCFCPSFPCDQNAPFNGMRWGCPPLQAPTQCDETAVTQYGHYPTPTPTPESCPSTDCNAGGSEFPVDYCAYPGIGCPSNYVATGSCCQPYNITPVIIDVDGSGFHLTSASDGVWFDFYGTGTRVKISWTEHSSTNTWLVLDRNGNGTIDNGSELFGNFTPQPEPPDGEEKNGFLALAEYDKAEKGGNGDRLITSSDTIFQWLRLWQDINHNGISEPSELHTFTELGLANLELDYKISKSTDQYGNQFRYRTKVKDVNGAQVGRWAWDVFLMGLN